MKSKTSVLISSIAASITLSCLQSSSTLAQPASSRFYCGSTDKQEPATMLVSKNDDKEKTFIIWRNNSGNKTPKQRCREVSQKFQKAWEQGNLKSFIGGENGGKSHVYGSSGNILFQVGSKGEGQSIANQLEQIRAGEGISPIEQ
jgi:hypothetical protein